MANILKSVLHSHDVVPLSYSRSLTAELSVLQENHKLRDIENMHKHECENSYERGYTQGIADGIIQERAQVVHQTNILNSLLKSIPEAICQNRVDLSEEITDIVLAITSQLFINQQQNKHAIAQQITQIITQLNNKHTIEILLHPDDLALLESGVITADLRECEIVHFIKDEQLRLGGCRIKSAHGMFDGSIERQIDSLKQVLIKIKQEQSLRSKDDEMA